MNIQLLLIIGLSILIVLALWKVFGSKYSDLFSPQHINELAAGLAKIKPLALAAPLQTHDDFSEENLEGKGFRTSHGLIVAYTIALEYEQYFHHLSLSHESGVIANSAVATLVSWITYLLQVKSEIVKLEHPTSGGIFYINFQFTPDEHQMYASRNVIVLQPNEVTQEVWQQLEPQRQLILQHLRRDPHLPQEHRT